MKLKTLKDLKYLGIAHKGHYKKSDALLFQDAIFLKIKQEAIKWVAYCPCEKVKIKIKDNNEPIREEWHRDYCFACLRFIEFFNITEEELEDEN